MRRTSDVRIAVPFSASLLLHVGAAALFFVARESTPQTFMPQTVSVRLVAAATGTPRIGAVPETPPKEAPKVTPPKAAPQRQNKEVTKQAVKAAPTTKVDPTRSTTVSEVRSSKASSDSKADTKTVKAPPIPDLAAGGAKGSTGTDVTTATFVGLEFPDPGYLTSIVNKIMSNFPMNSRPLITDFEFEIQRSGCIGSLRVIKKSGSVVFDAEAETAIRKAGQDCGFQQLPAAWKDDVLRIHFRFNPAILRGK